jgi:hypothetical protein
MLSKLLLMVLTCHAIFTCISQVEESKDNHFMYWVNRGYKGVLGAFKPPTKNLHSIKFPEWLKIAHTADEVCVLSFPFLLLSEEWSAFAILFCFFFRRGLVETFKHDRQVFIPPSICGF